MRINLLLENTRVYKKSILMLQFLIEGKLEKRNTDALWHLWMREKININRGRKSF